MPMEEENDFGQTLTIGGNQKFCSLKQLTKWAPLWSPKFMSFPVVKPTGFTSAPLLKAKRDWAAFIYCGALDQQTGKSIIDLLLKWFSYRTPWLLSAYDPNVLNESICGLRCSQILAPNRTVIYWADKQKEA